VRVLLGGAGGVLDAAATAAVYRAYNLQNAVPIKLDGGNTYVRARRAVPMRHDVALTRVLFVAAGLCALFVRAASSTTRRRPMDRTTHAHGIITRRCS
jgi:hypothetical protein